MKLPGNILIVIAGILLTLPVITTLYAESASVDEHDHHHESKSASEPVLNKGKKWQTDAPLRQGMHSINEEVLKAVPAFHDNALTKPQAEELAKYINEQVSFIVDNCKLDPEADAMLHFLAGELLSGATVLSVEPASEDGLPAMVKALLTYPLYFDDPEWGK